MAGFRTFATGEVLTAANVNDFLMKQSVMVFADAAARTTALGAEVAEGMLTFNKDTGALEVFDGTNFVPAGAEPPAGIGSNVVSAVKTNFFSSSSSSYVDIPDLSATITPSSASSKILVFAFVQTSYDNPDIQYGRFRIMRDATAVGLGTQGSGSQNNTFIAATQANRATATNGIVFLDSPETDAAVTYKLVVASRAVGAAPVIRVNQRTNADTSESPISTFTVIEVAP